VDGARGKFRELAEDWYETEIAGGRLRHPTVPRRYPDKYLIPEVGGAAPADISPAMAARLLARVAGKAPTAANDLLRYMRRVFRFAVRRHLIASSPVADFNLGEAGGKESGRQRASSRDELEKLFKALRDSPSFGGTNLLTIKLLLAVGVRKGELLRALHVGIDTLNAALAGVDHGLHAYTIHDLRRTMRTLLSSLGIRSEVAERCLNHKLPGIQCVYNGHDYFAERRTALETWTALLLEIERGERKVAPLRLRRTSAWYRSSEQEMPMPKLIAAERIARAIFVLRGQRVLLDTELAALYGVAPKVLLQSVKRNRKRFPADFMVNTIAGPPPITPP
jgi:hypothetical protein